MQFACHAAGGPIRARIGRSWRIVQREPRAACPPLGQDAPGAPSPWASHPPLRCRGAPQWEQGFSFACFAAQGLHGFAASVRGSPDRRGQFASARAT